MHTLAAERDVSRVGAVYYLEREKIKVLSRGGRRWRHVRITGAGGFLPTAVFADNYLAKRAQTFEIFKKKAS